MRALEGIDSEGALNLVDVEIVANSPRRMQFLNEKVLEECREAFVQPDLIPPLASHDVAF